MSSLRSVVKASIFVLLINLGACRSSQPVIEAQAGQTTLCLQVSNASSALSGFEQSYVYVNKIPAIAQKVADNIRKERPELITLAPEQAQNFEGELLEKGRDLPVDLLQAQLSPDSKYFILGRVWVFAKDWETKNRHLRTGQNIRSYVLKYGAAVEVGIYDKASGKQLGYKLAVERNRHEGRRRQPPTPLTIGFSRDKGLEGRVDILCRLLGKSVVETFGLKQ